METQNSRDCLSFRLYIVKKKSVKGLKTLLRKYKNICYENIFYITIFSLSLICDLAQQKMKLVFLQAFWDLLPLLALKSGKVLKTN